MWLSGSESSIVAEAFQGTADHTAWAYNQVAFGAWDSSTPLLQKNLSTDSTVNKASLAFFGKGKKFWRAVVRVVVAVAVTAVMVAIPVAAVVAIKPTAVILGIAASKGAGAVATTALVKGFTLGSFSVSSILGTGAAAGLKNAHKNWNKPWQGASEFTFGYKLKPLYHP